jgi:hypothetical protein
MDFRKTFFEKGGVSLFLSRRQGAPLLTPGDPLFAEWPAACHDGCAAMGLSPIHGQSARDKRVPLH